MGWTRWIAIFAASLALACGGTLVDASGLELALAYDAGGAGDAASMAPGPDAGRGLFCAQDDQCLCEACASDADCLSGLTCQQAKQNGNPCGRTVCLAPEAEH